jgi:hypothetical protein
VYVVAVWTFNYVFFASIWRLDGFHLMLAQLAAMLAAIATTP